MKKAVGGSPLVAVLQKAVLDESFRKKLIEDPQRATLDAGLELSPDQVDLIKKLNPEEWESLTLKDLNARLSAVSGLSGISWFWIF